MNKPLQGITVLDFTQFLSGPYCTMLLADLGADVIKIEKPGDGEVYRTYGPKFINGVSSSFLSVNRNKKSIAVDLKHPRSIEVISRLAGKADVLVENFKPKTMLKLGLDFETLRKFNENLIYCSISGFGQTGPYSDRGGFDLIVQGMSGIMSVTGESDGPPVKVGFPIADMGASVFAAIAILTSLLGRVKDGRGGEHIDVSLFEASLAWATLPIGNYFADGEIPRRMGSASPQNAPYQAFQTKDGYITVGTGNQHLWEILCSILSVEYLIQEPRFIDNASRVKNQHILAPLLEERFRQNSSVYWIELLNDKGIPTGSICNLQEAIEDPHTIERESIWEIEHARAGKIKTMGLPFKMSATELKQVSPPPELGEHTDEVLLSTAGFTKQEVSQLKLEGVIGGK